jgi:predicted GNAT family N-acyltransferase
MKEMTTVCTEVKHGTKEYDQTVALRDEVLRRPLGLELNLEELAEESDSFHLTCWRGDMLAACLVLKPLSCNRVRMRQLAVHRGLQGQGIGRMLVKNSELFARDHGYEEIVLHARETAVGFYEKTGYEVDGDRFVEVTIPHFSMRKKLVSDGEQAPEPYA